MDCYLLTRDYLEPGTIVDCEPFGLLLPDEGGEIGHKVLGALPGQEDEIGPGLLSELQAFISALFAEFPAISVSVGPFFRARPPCATSRTIAAPELIHAPKLERRVSGVDGEQKQPAQRQALLVEAE